MYVYQIPFEEQKHLAAILDPNKEWEKLAGIMGYTGQDVFILRQVTSRGDSPTTELLRMWGSKGHTVDNLLKLLFKLKYQRAVRILLPFVDPKLQTLINESSKTDFQGNSCKPSSLESPVLSAVPACGGIVSNAVVSSPTSGRPSNPHTPVISSCKNCSGISGSDHVMLPCSSGSTMDSSIAVGLHSTLCITYNELAVATGNFAQSNVLGRGGYGIVYKGVWKHTPVAVKRLGVNQKNASSASAEKDRVKQSLMELKTLALYRHDNILPLYGYSLDGAEPCLVYQFLAGGSLEDRLLCRQNSTPLSWSQRFNIVKGSACGLNFLHTCAREPLIHGDIKCANILLDGHMEPKIGDFGLCRRGVIETPGNRPPLIASHIKGTLAYLPPEFIRSKHLSTKLDVYSFGVVMFELATGLRAYSESRKPENLVDFMKHNKRENSNLLHLADSNGGTDASMEIYFVTLVDLGFCATSTDANERPSIKEILDYYDQITSKSN